MSTILTNYKSLLLNTLEYILFTNIDYSFKLVESTLFYYCGVNQCVSPTPTIFQIY